ncbi:MAG: 2-C-methyl-D-erythritol 4-phosphate cytidylyltransferase [Eubacterium sp.]|nr:2-C-methyl-D-erythritol 4-phosphate cytidylyltransferase [Eubacterium sp.]
MNIVTILANGVGQRFGSSVPKQFHKVNGKMVIEYVIESVLSSKSTDKLVIATNVEANKVYFEEICKNNDIDLIEGGDTRNRTLKRVIDYIDSRYNCKKLIVCDAVRPMITGELLDSYFAFLDENAAVVTAQKITDSLGCYDFQKVDRERYYLMQSPEGFDFPLLRDSFDSESKLTEVTQQLPEDSKIHLYFDFTNNFKLTYPADLKYLEALIKES